MRGALVARERATVDYSLDVGVHALGRAHGGGGDAASDARLSEATGRVLELEKGLARAMEEGARKKLDAAVRGARENSVNSINLRGTCKKKISRQIGRHSDDCHAPLTIANTAVTH